MKRLTKLLLISLCVIAILLTVVACDGLPEPTNPNKPSDSNTPNDSSTPNNDKKTFTGITLNDLTVEWDGEEHEVTISGTLPDGAKVAYENNKATEEGVYNVKATVTAEGYETLILTAKLTITESTDPDAPPKITGVTFNDLTVDYNGQEHELTVSGTLPEGAKVEYQNNKATNAGEYNATAIITAEGYITLKLSAKLTITKLNFTGLTLSDLSVTYDGAEHEITLQGNVPEGANVVYQSHKATNAGTYNAKVTVSKENYNTLELTATLTINKANFTGLTLKNKTTIYNGKEHKVEIEGDLPEGTNVAYQHNAETAEGTYNVSAVITNPNYNPLTLTATLRIINVSSVAKTAVDGLVNAPDPWSFIPEGLRMDNMSYSQMPVNDFTSFVNVSTIGKKAIGKQLNVLYDGLIDTASALAYVDKVYAVAGTIADLYQNFINANPEDYAEFGGEAGGFKFYIQLDGDNSLLLAGNSTVSMELQYNSETGVRKGRIQVTNGVAIKYDASETHLKLAIKATIAGVGNIKQIEFAKNDTTTTGYLYEYTGTESKNLKTSAVIAFNETKTVIVSNKRETDDLTIKGYEEVYNSQTGEYIGGEVGETVKSIEYDTLWFMLGDVTSINSIKAIHETNGLNADTIYINNSTEAIKTKLVGGFSLKAASRRFDIEMKDVWYVVATTTDGKTTYEKQKASIPMLFVQKEQTATLGEDMYNANKNSGMTSTPTLPSAKMTDITNDFEQMAQLFATIKEQVTFADINNYIGANNPWFSQQ